MSRDNTETKFSFKAFRNLKKGLGEFDAVVECNELAIREFLKNLDTATEKEKFIQTLSEKHSIKVDSVNVNYFSARIRQFYILSVLQQAEQFFDEFKKEYKTYYEKWIEKESGDTDFDNVLLNIFNTTTQGINEIGEEVYLAFEYYRLVRNRFAHSEEKDLKKLDSYWSKITGFSDFYSQSFHCSGAPNKYVNVDFNDFLLITNVVKHIGYTICEKCRPDNALLAKKICELETTVNEKKINPIKNVMRLKDNKDRFLNALENLLNSTFGKINRKDTVDIAENVKRILA